MANMKTCRECGRTYDVSRSGASRYREYYCSDKCMRSGEAAGAAKAAANSKESIESLSRLLHLIGIVFVGLVTALTALFYVFPKFLKGKSKKLLYAYIILWAVLIAFSLVYFLVLRPIPPTKIVSASCETEAEFVSIVKKALSGVSGWTVIEGEEFTSYSRQARDLVKEKDSLFNDSVYFVRLPDSVNAYIWFETENKTTAFVYKQNEDSKEKPRQIE